MHDHADVAQMLEIELVTSQGHYAYNSDLQLFSSWWDAGQETVMRKTDSTWLSFKGRHDILINFLKGWLLSYSSISNKL